MNNKKLKRALNRMGRWQTVYQIIFYKFGWFSLASYIQKKYLLPAFDEAKLEYKNSVSNPVNS